MCYENRTTAKATDTIRRAVERIRVSLGASDGSGLLPRAPSNFAEGPLQFTQLHRHKFVALLSGAVGCMGRVRWDV